MINRTLIRIKVVQMLYSYMLTRSEFKIDAAPESTSRDRKFGYTVYIDLLLLLLELSGIRVNRPDGTQPAVAVDPKLTTNRVGRSLFDNDSIKSLILRGNNDLPAFDPLLQPLADAIASSKVFTDYKHKTRRTLQDDVRLWTTVLQTIIARSSDVEAALRQNPAYTVAGFRMGLRECVDTLESFNDSRETYASAKKDLKASLDKAYELYVSMLALADELTAAQERRIEANKSKHLATPDDLNPNTRFIDNGFIAALRNNPSYIELCERFRPAWADDPIFIGHLLDQLIQSPCYRDYMAADTVDFADDCEFWRIAMRDVILPSDELAEALEEKSVFWNDDLFIMGTFVLKTIRRFATDGPDVPLLPQYKDDEDAKFGAELFDYAVENREQYRSLIDSFIDLRSWDPERLAFMDIVIMITAIAELVNYPAIPVAVTMNEYIEIANNYSTDKSGQFINGILYNVIRRLSDEGILVKPFEQRENQQK